MIINRSQQEAVSAFMVRALEGDQYDPGGIFPSPPPMQNRIPIYRLSYLYQTRYIQKGGLGNFFPWPQGAWGSLTLPRLLIEEM